MVTEYALLLELPSLQESIVRRYRHDLLAAGWLPCPYPYGIVLFSGESPAVLRGKNTPEVIRTLPEGNWVLELNNPEQHHGVAGIRIIPEAFFSAMNDGKSASGAVVNGLSGDLMPLGFLPLALNPDGLELSLPEYDPKISGASSRWSKLLLRSLRIEYPKGQSQASEALIWYPVDTLTVLPADKAYR